MHFSIVHFVLCQFFGLNHLTPPLNAFFSPLLSIASTLSTQSELKRAITSPKKGQAMQRCHEEQSARSKGARLSPLERTTNCTRQLLTTTLSALAVAARSYCHPRHHVNVGTPCLRPPQQIFLAEPQSARSVDNFSKVFKKSEICSAA